jgi:hypothetical protein
MKLIRLWRVEPKDIFEIASKLNSGSQYAIARFHGLLKIVVCVEL